VRPGVVPAFAATDFPDLVLRAAAGHDGLVAGENADRAENGCDGRCRGQRGSQQHGGGATAATLGLDFPATLP
jgi:hypothetical protein